MLDVLVVGGGPVGACAGALLARATAQAPLRVRVLEPHAGCDRRTEAAARCARARACRAPAREFSSAAGAWAAISRPRLEPYERMRVWHEGVHPRSDEVLEFDAAEAGEPNLGYIVENRLHQAALLDAFARPAGEVDRWRVARA